MVLHEKELKKNKNRIALVRSAASEKIIIKPNERKEIKGYIDRIVDHPTTTAIIQESETSTLPDCIDITPAVIQHVHGNRRQEIPVALSNISTNAVVISPKTILCELQPVQVTDTEEMEKKQQRADIIERLKIDEDNVLSEEEKVKLKNLRQHQDIFSVGDIDIGECNLVKHRIDLLNDVPFKQKHRRIPPSMIKEVRQHIEQLLAGDIIRPPKSPWTSNVVLVRKKNEKLRLCVDYRMLNDRTVKDSYALPRMEEIFDCLHGARYFTTLDMKSGYHQVELEECHKERTAFTVGSLGFYEYNKMPFGLTNAPATYQRLMQECLCDYNTKICLIYLDDVIIFSSTYGKHLERPDLVLTHWKDCGLKLAPEKCCFFKQKVSYLDHVVSDEGVETDPSKIEKVKSWPTPSNADELRSFLAFAGY